MRWFWIDRFLEFRSGQYAAAIKNVSMAEDYLESGLRGHPLMPPSLIIEGMAQAGGLLVGEHNHFRERVVLAKIAKSRFYQVVGPGDTLLHRATLASMQPGGAMVQGTVHLGGTLLAEMELVFAHLDERFPSELFEPAAFLRLLRILKLYEVGRQADGSPLVIPERLLRAERAAAGEMQGLDTKD